jgi:hypothetical protein
MIEIQTAAIIPATLVTSVSLLAAAIVDARTPPIPNK